MAKCADVMTREPACCEAGDSIARAAQLMKSEDVGAVPVVESKSRTGLVGIVTDRDIVVKVLAAGRAVEGATVRDAMTQNPVTVREDDDVSGRVGDGGSQGAPHSRRRRAGTPAGIIAQADIATRLHRDKTTGDLVEAISEPQTVRK